MTVKIVKPLFGYCEYDIFLCTVAINEYTEDQMSTDDVDCLFLRGTILMYFE